MSLYKKRCTQTYEDAIEIGALQKNNEVQVESYRTRTRGALQARLEVGLEVEDVWAPISTIVPVIVFEAATISTTTHSALSTLSPHHSTPVTHPPSTLARTR